MFCGVATKRGLIATVVVAWGVLLSSKEDMKEAVQWLAVTAFTVAVAVYVMHTKKSPNSLDLPAVQVPPSVRRAYPIFDSARDGESFSSMCETLIVEAVNDLALYEVQPSETNWILEMLRYNVQGGKMNRGLMVVSAGRILFDSVRSGATNDDLCRCAVLGWCIEFLQAWLLIADDYMDSSVTRRGRQCWYRVEGVDKIAINDAFLTEMIMFKMLKRHFGHMSCYNQLVDLLLETTIQTEVGQLLDLRCAHVDLDSLTVDRWTLIVQYKTAYYSFYLPVAMAMILAGITDRSEYDAAREILLILGIYFQAQDDFLDAFGDPKKIGKIGTDIQDKKCSWLFVNAYHSLCNEEQRAYLREHYGNCKVGSVEEQRIKQIYEQAGMRKLYRDYEQSVRDKILALKHKIRIVPWSVFETCLNKIFRRTK